MMNRKHFLNYLVIALIALGCNEKKKECEKLNGYFEYQHILEVVHLPSEKISHCLSKELPSKDEIAALTIVLDKDLTNYKRASDGTILLPNHQYSTMIQIFQLETKVYEYMRKVDGFEMPKRWIPDSLVTKRCKCESLN